MYHVLSATNYAELKLRSGAKVAPPVPRHRLLWVENEEEALEYRNLQ